MVLRHLAVRTLGHQVSLGVQGFVVIGWPLLGLHRREILEWDLDIMVFNNLLKLLSFDITHLEIF